MIKWKFCRTHHDDLSTVAIPQSALISEPVTRASWVYVPFSNPFEELAIPTNHELNDQTTWTQYSDVIGKSS